MSAEAWNNIQLASFKISEMAQVTPISFQIADEQIIGKQEKGVYFGCNMQQILFWGGPGRCPRPVQWASYLSGMFQKKNKQGG